MFKQWMCGAILTLGMVVLAGCASQQNAQKQAEQVLGVQPIALVSRTAGDSATLTEPKVCLINDAKTLEATKSAELAALKVDFETQSLIVLALGECPTGGYWAHIQSVQTLGDQVIVQSLANQPGEGEKVTQAVTHPFEAVVVHKVNGTAVAHTQSVQGQTHPSDAIAKD